MSGALLQLATLGSQDAYITGDPEITLFKSKYYKHTHFGTETVQVSFDGNFNFGSINEATATIEKYGDLISKMILVIELDQVTNEDIEWGYVNKLGHAIVNEISVSIGQTEIDVHYSDWINVYYDLYANKSHDDNYNKMIGNTSGMKDFTNTHSSYKLFIPVHFWFTKTSTSSFPLCAIEQINFQIKVRLNEALECVNYKGTTAPTNLPNVSNAYFLVDYIFLGDEEKNLFQTQTSKYLIEQVQEMTENIITSQSSFNLIFDKPCKYLLWYVTLERYKDRNAFLTWANDDDWNKAKDNFAKLLWLATRENLTFDSSNNPIITLSSSVTNVNNSLSTVSNGLSLLETLSSKVSGLFLFASVDSDDTTQYNIDATIDNVILLENNLTFEDISYTISELTADSDSSSTVKSNQVTFLQQNQYNIIDIFNSGNFINRKDNPIIRSSLLLNGKERIQERDGVYFNYLIPYYYFKNTPQDGLNIYSFALSPTDIQPSGTINFGQVNTKQLKLTMGKQNVSSSSYFNDFFKSGTLRIFVMNYTMLNVNPIENLVTLDYI